LPHLLTDKDLKTQLIKNYLGVPLRVGLSVVHGTLLQSLTQKIGANFYGCEAACSDRNHNAGVQGNPGGTKIETDGLTITSPTPTVFFLIVKASYL
jgi:hypothetical protein